MRTIVGRTALILAGLSGCGGEFESPREGGKSAAPARAAAEPAAVLAQQNRPAGAGGQVAASEPIAGAATLKRQIIYDADVRLVVEDFEGIPEMIELIVVEAGGFVAQAKLGGHTGSPRSGLWKVRLPVDKYSGFLEQARKLGELESLASNSQDLTEQYYDLEARIRNKQKEEARLLKHLEETTGKLEEILTVEREISRIREELERMEGKMRVLQDLVSLATVTLRVDEMKGYVPAEAPTFAVRLGRAFFGSWHALVSTGETAAVAGAAAGPWLAIVGLPFAAVLSIIRRRRRAA